MTTMELLQVARDMRDSGRHADAERVMEEAQPDYAYVRRNCRRVFMSAPPDAGVMTEWQHTTWHVSALTTWKAVVFTGAAP